MDEDSVGAALDNALLTPQPMAAGPEPWITLPEPLPAGFDDITAGKDG